MELQNIFDDLKIVERSTPEKPSTKWQFLFTTNVTVSAALLKSVSVVYKDVLLPPRPVRPTDFNCLIYKANKERYNDNLCLLRASSMHKSGTERFEEETSKLLDQNLDIVPNVTADISRGVALEVLHIVERWAEVFLLVYDIEVLDTRIIGEFVDRSSRRLSSTANLLRYKNHVCYVKDASKVFKWFCCSTCDKFSRQSSKLQRKLRKCEKLVRNINPRSVPQIRKFFSKN